MTLTHAVIRTRFEGIHCWPEAPEDVKFLRTPHRHEFHVCAKMQQFHDDRDIEYILAKRALDAWLRLEQPKWPMRSSCEAMASRIIGYLRATYGDHRTYMVSVTEDGENGAEVFFDRSMGDDGK